LTRMAWHTGAQISPYASVAAPLLVITASPLVILAQAGIQCGNHSAP
jgi:hypothetical protein